MANEKNIKLDNLVSSYGKHDEQLKDIKKVCDSEKDELKSLMNEEYNKHTSGGYTVSYRTSEKTSVDESKMLEVLKRDWVAKNGSMACPYIKMRPYIDMDELENAIYAGEIPKETLLELDGCKTTTKVVSIYCTKAKEGK